MSIQIGDRVKARCSGYASNTFSKTREMLKDETGIVIIVKGSNILVKCDIDSVLIGRVNTYLDVIASTVKKRKLINIYK